MRAAAGLLIVLYAGALSQVRAAEPPPLSPPQSPAAPTEQQSATAPGGEHSTAAPAVTPNSGVTATSAVTPTPAVAATSADGKAPLTREEHDLISRGYKLEIRHGEKYFCRRESELGSHFDVKTCNTAESIEAHRANSVETVREMQANKPEINK
jgi:hypothetical protein